MSTSKQLPFESNEAAFEYACQFMDNSLCENAELTAMVISPSTYTYREFRCIRVNVATKEGAMLAHAMVNQKTVEILKKGDLVSWTALKVVPFSDRDKYSEFRIWLRIINHKLQPLLDTEKGWAVYTD